MELIRPWASRMVELGAGVGPECTFSSFFTFSTSSILTSFQLHSRGSKDADQLGADEERQPSNHRTFFLRLRLRAHDARSRRPAQ